MTLLHHAKVQQDELAQAIRIATSIVKRRQALPPLSIRAIKSELVISTPSSEARTPFSGEWEAEIKVSGEALKRLVAKHQGRKPVVLSYAAGYLSVGPTRISAEEVKIKVAAKSPADGLENLLLPGLPTSLIRTAYGAAAGNEIDSGKFANPESSAALAANTFGYFLERPRDLPALPGTGDLSWPALTIGLEQTVRFPWSGGHHPCLDVLIVTKSDLLGIESKRFEPFRPKTRSSFSSAYSRDVWGASMGRYQAVRDALTAGTLTFQHLDAIQLVKHAFGLRTAAHGDVAARGKAPALLYLYSEPGYWPDGRPVAGSAILRHRDEVAMFAELVAGDEVRFLSCSYRDVLESWAQHRNPALRQHGAAVAKRFSP